jgi:hypothetical protein
LERRVNQYSEPFLPAQELSGNLPAAALHSLMRTTELSRQFCEAYRVCNPHRVGHHGAVLMPKAPLFFDHFDWIPIGNSERIVLLCAGSWPSWPSVASGEGKQVVIAAIPRDRFTRKRPRAIGKPLDTSMY